MDGFNRLPEGLPVPEDDGAADHLDGLELPTGLSLPSTQGGQVDLASAALGRLVAYVYPRTGVPGEPMPAGWDDIPGPRGCTPQSCAYRDALAEFDRLGAAVVGISAQSPEEQAEFAAREHIPFPLLSDPGLVLADALALPTFEVEGMTLYRRLTLVAGRPGRQGLLPRLPARQGCRRGARLAGRADLMEAAGIEPASAIVVRGSLQV